MKIKQGLASMLSHRHKSLDTILKQGLGFVLTDICARKHEVFRSDIM